MKAEVEIKSPFQEVTAHEVLKNFLENTIGIVPLEEWDERVLPILEKYNDSLENKLEAEELKAVYDLAIRIEVEKRSKPNVYLPALSFSSLIRRKFPPLRFILTPFFETGTVNMITAPPNNWKSWIMFLMSAHIASGTPFLEKYETVKTKVMIINEEDSLRLIQDRYRILGITDTDLPIYFRVAHGAKLTQEYIKNLLEEVKRLDIQVVMFDSLRSVHDANENDSQEMQKVMDIFKQLARENITVIFTHHNRKKSPFGKQDDAEATRGSSGINASISGHLSLSEIQREDETFIVVQHLKSKVGEKEKPFEIKIEVTKEQDEVKKIDFTFAGEFKKSEQKLQETKDAVMDTLQPDVWLSLKDLQERKIGGVNMIRQALTVLTKDGLVLKQTRKQLSEKYIKVSEGSMKENLFSLAGEKTEEISTDDFDF